MITYILVSITLLASGVIQGLTGFGSALVAMPLLTLFIDVKTAVSLCILNSLLMTSYLSWNMRKHVETKKVLPLVIGSIPGIAGGVFFLKHMDPAIIQVMLGVLIVVYSLYSLYFKPAPRRLHSAWSYIAGFGTGFIGSAFSAGGPPTIIYTTLTGWSKDHIKATLSGFFFVSSFIVTIAHAISGLTTDAVLKYFAVSVPFIIIGVVTGTGIYRKVERKDFITIILYTLILLGGLMVFTA